MSITKLSPNWAYQMGPIHFINFLLSGSNEYTLTLILTLQPTRNMNRGDHRGEITGGNHRGRSPMGRSPMGKLPREITGGNHRGEFLAASKIFSYSQGFVTVRRRYGVSGNENDESINHHPTLGSRCHNK